MSKNLLYLVGGIALGATATYFSVKKYYRDLAEKEISEMREYFKAKAFDEIESFKDDDDLETVDSSMVLKDRKAFTGSTDKLTGFLNLSDVNKYDEKDYTSYNKIKEDYISEEAASAANEHPMDDEEYKEPYIIMGSEHPLVDSYYDATTLLYYTDDDILVDESTNELFDDIRDVGYDNIQHFSNSSDEVCYIRNERLNMEYEVVKFHGSWSD